MISGPAVTLALALVLLGGAVSQARAEPAAAGCAVAPELSVIEPVLAHSAAHFEKGLPLTIVAVGSSSTQGTGASTPESNYPSQLEADLKERFPKADIHVMNRGKGGEDVGEELMRLGRDVLGDHPDLVIWQLGTNAVLRRDDISADEDMIRRGVALLKDAGADVVLMDMQYAPRVLERSAYPTMERMIAEAAAQAHVGLFRRFEIMRQWQAEQAADMPPIVGPDGLHMTDRGYACLAAGLAESLAWNWWSHQKIAHRRRTPTVAGLGPEPAHNGSPPSVAGP